jgi:hypothetical protein
MHLVVQRIGAGAIAMPVCCHIGPKSGSILVMNEAESLALPPIVGAQGPF